MTQRLNPMPHFSLVKPLIDLGTAVYQGLDPAIVELIEIRASQINGCAVCLVMHTRAARKRGETEERIYLMDAWRESHLFSERERAVLGWTEALTSLERGGASDEAYQALAAHFSEEEQIRITMAIGAINAFNRMNIGFRVSPQMLGEEVGR